jgi:hypothetical protein
MVYALVYYTNVGLQFIPRILIVSGKISGNSAFSRDDAKTGGFSAEITSSNFSKRALFGTVLARDFFRVFFLFFPFFESVFDGFGFEGDTTLNGNENAPLTNPRAFPV